MPAVDDAVGAVGQPRELEVDGARRRRAIAVAEHADGSGEQQQPTGLECPGPGQSLAVRRGRRPAHVFVEFAENEDRWCLSAHDLGRAKSLVGGPLRIHELQSLAAEIRNIARKLMAWTKK